jgi:D-beta-D-heptose 7-phosphate kinase/D-beta-D-heptose 1-phosphate adenosyltransferase
VKKKETVSNSLPGRRLEHLVNAARRTRVIVVGDVMLDQFIWGNVSRISPEAPVPVVDFGRESYMPGGAANVARNLASLRVKPLLFGLIGRDHSGKTLKTLLTEQGVDCCGLTSQDDRHTSIKTRIIAHQQQLVRLDRETRQDSDGLSTRRMLAALKARLRDVDAIIVGDYGKGVVTQALLDELKRLCRANGIWLSLDPKPVHRLDLSGLSLITPNRKEAFELADLVDQPPQDRPANPLEDVLLLRTAHKLVTELGPALLLITLGDQGMLLCGKDQAPFHIPTVAQEVYDVSGAGDTVIASFTAAGVVVGKFGTATVAPGELLASFNGFRRKPSNSVANKYRQ